MDPDVISFGVVCAIIIASIGALAGIGIIAWRAIRTTHARALPASVEDTARLDQIQQAIEAISVEVERMAEAQRFSARLLAERADQPLLPR